jgi:hypothetical protein
MAMETTGLIALGISAALLYLDYSVGKRAKEKLKNAELHARKQ